MPNLKNKTKFNGSSVVKNSGWLEKYQVGGKTLEQKINKALGEPMKKAADAAINNKKWFNKETKKWEVEDDIDNFRHPMAARYTAEAIANKFPDWMKYSGIPQVAGFVGSTALGVGHELANNKYTSNNPKDYPNYTFWDTVSEAGEDAFNNMVGAGVGVLPISDDKKTAYLRYLSDNNKIPDGYANKKANMYFKRNGGLIDTYGDNPKTEVGKALKEYENDKDPIAHLKWGKYIDDPKRREQHIIDVYQYLMDSNWEPNSIVDFMKKNGAYGSKNRGNIAKKGADWGWDSEDINNEVLGKAWDDYYNNRTVYDKKEYGGWLDTYQVGGLKSVTGPAPKFDAKTEAESKRIASGYNNANKQNAQISQTRNWSQADQEHSDRVKARINNPASDVGLLGANMASNITRFRNLTPEEIARVTDNPGETINLSSEMLKDGLINELVGYGATKVIPFVYKSAKAAGKYLTEQTALKNAYKLNPLANKEVPLNKLYHKTNNPNLSLDEIDLLRLGKSQSKKRHLSMLESERPSGFYTSDEAFYPFMGGKSKFSFDFPANAKIKDLKLEGRITDRISQNELKELQKEGYDLIRGENMIGQTEYIPLNKSKISNWNFEGTPGESNVIPGAADQSVFDHLKKLKDQRFETVNSHWLKGYPKVPKELPGSSNKFKSEIDWSKWNKEIPDNTQLMKEYNTIEQTSKANGTWMKNPDGSKFEGTPEQFIQQNSQNFKKAFPEGSENVFRGTGENIAELRPNRSTFTANQELASGYAPYNKKFNLLNSESTEGGLHNFYRKNSKNSLELDANNTSWTSVDLSNKRLTKDYFERNIKSQEDQITKQREYLSKMKQNPGGSWEAPDGTTYSNDLYKNTVNERELYLKDLKERYKNIDNLISNPKELEEMRKVLGNTTTTDDIAAYIEKRNLDYVKLKNIEDSGIGDVTIVNHKPGNYLKSAVGNNGMFDMTNPNIYKAAIPIGLGVAALQNKQDNSQWLDKYK